MAEDVLIGVVGPCAAGKSTLIAGLRLRGYKIRHIAQEHSYVKDMWKRITNPDILIYLDVSYPASCVRRNMDWTEREYEQEIFRLRDARAHANYYLNTDGLSIEEVFNRVYTYLANITSQKAPS